MKVQLSLISDYRAQLMGLATLGIIICHCPANNVLMPKILEYAMFTGKTGVALFFFLSGFGLFYSLSKNTYSIISWYKKRYIRLLVPYLLFCLFPGFIEALIDPNTDWLHYFAKFTFLSYWKYHDCPWFLAVLIPLYAISPLLYRLIIRGNGKVTNWLLLLTPFTLLPLLQTGNVIFDTICYDTTNGVAFVVGMIIAYNAQQTKTVSCWVCLWVGIFYCIMFFFQHRNFSTWYTGLLFISLPILVYLLDRFKIHWIWLSSLGAISLESYLTNTGLPKHVAMIPWEEFGVNNFGNYLGYTIVIVGGLLWAMLLHYASKPIIHLLSKS